jgi:type II secretory pathway pseudopilin PulG
MPSWGWILIAILVVVAVLAIIVAARATSSRKRSEGLKERFGPEYERVVDDAGDQRAAESELAAREKNRKKLDIVPLPIESAERYADEWRAVQTAFIDSPAVAVGDADRLVNEVMRERGYPVDDFDQRAADISVDHPKVVESYRAAHTIYLSQEHGDIGTEDQREAFVHYRALFEKLLDTEQETPKEARA